MKPRRTRQQARDGLVAAAIEDTRRFLELLRPRVATDDGRSWRFLEKAQLSPITYNGRNGSFALPLKWNDKKALALVEQANRGNTDADRVLREATAELLQRRQALPDSLRDWLTDYLVSDARPGGKGKPRRGPKPRTLASRDHTLALAVKRLTHKHWGFAPTRHREMKAVESGCSIVHKALAGLPGINLSESGVEKIWERHRHKL
jgi:hypothetical protein